VVDPGRRFGVYLHVPFCTTRCGYCDFNTYTADELGPGASRATYADTVISELRLAAQVLADGGRPQRQVATVFVGGGTPTLLPAADLGRMVDAVGELFGLHAGAEVTTEANPDSVSEQSLHELRAAGFTRISFGMQSAVPAVLATLDRTHTPGRVADAVGWARAAGFEQVSLDLIYGTPGESAADWRYSVEQALDLHPDHISAYALIVEEGTALAGRIRRAELAAVDDDLLADAYLAADDLLSAAGLTWYEVSNWAARPDAQCRHNLGYWRSDDWWGAGPGAHSHVGGVRWWNVKHPAAYAQRLSAGTSPAHAREVLGAQDRRVESVLLQVRLAEGCPLSVLRPAGAAAAAWFAANGLVDPAALAGGIVVLTRQGRLLADAVVRDVVD
jgi:putative oxygen-independent coproporphyrinogen III oxidase